MDLVQIVVNTTEQASNATEATPGNTLAVAEPTPGNATAEHTQAEATGAVPDPTPGDATQAEAKATEGEEEAQQRKTDDDDDGDDDGGVLMVATYDGSACPVYRRVKTGTKKRAQQRRAPSRAEKDGALARAEGDAKQRAASRAASRG